MEERWCSRRNGGAACSCSSGGEWISQRRSRDRGTITCWFLKDEGGALLCKAAPNDGRQEVPRWGRMGLVASSALRKGATVSVGLTGACGSDDGLDNGDIYFREKDTGPGGPAI